MRRIIAMLLVAAMAAVSLVTASALVEIPAAEVVSITKAGKITLSTGKTADGIGYAIYTDEGKQSTGRVAVKNGKAAVKPAFKSGVVYKVRAKAYVMNGKTRVYGKWSAYKYYAVAPAITYKWTAKGLKISWTEVKGAEYYNLRVERSNNANKYSRITKITANSYLFPYANISYMSINKVYKITVAPYVKGNKLASGTATTTDIEIVGHRGAMDAAPQNSLMAFQKAYEFNYDSVEADYWETKSGELFVIHDRMLTICGHPEIDVTTLTEETIKNYPIVKGSNVKSFDTQYIPRLEQLIYAASVWKLKVYLHTKQADISDAGLKQVAHIIKSYGMEKKVTVFTSNKNTLKRIAKQKCLTGYLIQANDAAGLKSGIKYAKTTGAKTTICRYSGIVSKSVAKYAHDLGVRFGCYDVNDFETGCKMSNLGADFLITNNYFLRDTAEMVI